MRRFRLYREISRGCAIAVLMAASGTAYAIPPLGLTQIDPDAEGGALVSIYDGTAYLSTTVHDPTGTVWIVGSDGSLDIRQVSHPELGARSIPTRVVKGPDGSLYVGAGFLVPSSQDGFTGSALFSLDEPDAPVVTWDAIIVGLDASLRGVGYAEGTSAEFYIDGTYRLFDLPEDPFHGGPIFTNITDVSESGYAVGGAQQPGTAGIVGAIWSPEGEFSFLGDLGAYSVRDRSDGQGVNIGLEADPTVIYGDQPEVRLQGPDDTNPPFYPVVVSQSDFAVAEALRTGAYAYYPGIVPAEPNMALLIEEVFPELTTINFEGVRDLYAIEGHIYMTLYGEDGLYLFGARDPLVIPEPSTVVLAVLLAGGVFVCRRSMFRRNCDASAVC